MLFQYRFGITHRVGPALDEHTGKLCIQEPYKSDYSMNTSRLALATNSDLVKSYIRYITKLNTDNILKSQHF